MNIVTGEQMAEIDRRTIEEFGLDGQVLMETAGRSVANWLHSQVTGPGPVAFLCGPGNNGGDGWVAARAWTDLGGQAVVYFMSDKVAGDALRNYQRALKWNIQHHKIEAEPPSWDQYRFVVDALFGTGLKRELTGDVADWVNSLPSHKTVAVDIPSGIDSANGQILGTAVSANATVTFGLPKWGQLLQPGASHCGELVVETIGFPRSLLDSELSQGKLLTPELARRWLPIGGPGTHKGSAGKLLVVAGSRRYPGAGCLATLGALRAGAGLVYTYAPSAVLQRLPIEAIPIEAKGDFLSGKDLEPIWEALRSVDVLCLGPGLGDQSETLELVNQLLKQCRCPAVVDADALRALPEKLNPSVLLTPHAGELGRMLGCTSEEVGLQRLERVREAATRWNCSVLLKGDPTLVCEPNGKIVLSNQGTAVLAQGGSGDVLSGLATALLARGLTAQESGALAAYLHGVAGQLSQVSTGLGAQALSEHIPQAITKTAGINRRGSRQGI